MPLLIKLSGFLLILCASTSVGFLQSQKLRFRFNKLSALHRSMAELKERIRLNGGEINRIISESFEEKLIHIKDGKITVVEKGLVPEDINLLQEFLSDIGMSDVKAECDRTELYMTLIAKQCTEAEKKCNELCKLYNTLGFLCGIFICIFLL